MSARRLPGLLGVALLAGPAAGSARADDDHHRVSVSVSVLPLLVPVFQLNAELAVHPRWSVALRGGAGRPSFFDQPAWIVEVGGQAIYYVRGNASGGIQLGLDARYVGYEGDGRYFELGDGIAVGPFVGYKRVFGSGVTLGAQLGAQVVAVGESEQPVLPYLAITAGLSFGRTGGVPAAAGAGSAVPLHPLDRHRGFMASAGLGVGVPVMSGCSGCELMPGLVVGASLGWFIHRRVALTVDSTAIVAMFSGGAIGSFGFGLTSLAVQAWPHPDFWVKVGVGGAQITSLTLGAGSGPETGGGGTLAVGWDFHHGRRHGMDLQLRASHGSFDDDDFDGVDAFVGLVGVHWY